MAQDKTIIRVAKNRENPYVMINKTPIHDDRLSWKALGLLVYLLSKPDNWTIMVCDLVKQKKDGRDSVYSGLKELENAGYLSRRRDRDEKGKFGAIEYVVYETPQSVDTTENLPHPENPEMDDLATSGKSVSGKSDTTNKRETNNNKKIEREREDAADAAPISDSGLEFEYQLLEEIVEEFYPKDNTGGNLNRRVEAADIWRMWRTKYRQLTIYHVYAAVYTTTNSPHSTGYDATAIIVKRLEHAQELLIPMKQIAMNNVVTIKQRLIEKSERS